VVGTGQGKIAFMKIPNLAIFKTRINLICKNHWRTI